MNKYTNRKYIKNILIFFISIAILFLFFYIWERYVIDSEIPKRILPKPTDIKDYLYKEFFTEHRQGYETILDKSIQSFIDALIGFAISIVLGTLLGYLFAIKRIINTSLSPLLFVIQLLPVPAFAPVIAAILGYGLETKLFIIVLFTIFPVVITVSDTVMNLPSNYKSLLRTYNTPRLKSFFILTFPSIVPNLLHTMKILTTASFVASIIAELPLTVSNGIGKDIYTSFNNQVIPRVWASMLIIAVISLGFFFSVSYLEQFISKTYKYGQFEK